MIGIGYLLGSISFAVLFVRMYGVDIFKSGSGNPGAANVTRVLGKRVGYCVFGLDCLKGGVAAGWPLLACRAFQQPELLGILGLTAAVLGHSFSVFLKFRGGKGVAVTLGGLLLLMPHVLLVGAIVWGMVFFVTRYVSFASLCLGVSLPIAAWLLGLRGYLFGFTVALSLVIAIRHRSNIVRLLQGRENRFERKR